MNLFFPLALCFLLSTAPPQTTQEPATEQRIDLLVERLEHLARENHVPGMGLAVVTPDGVFTRGIGVADLESGREVTPETIFEIGSITKTFTAVLVARLAAEGKIDFDDPVREHVPYFHLKDPVADEQVTLRDLLSHRTGVTRTDFLLGGGEEVTVEDVVRQLALAEPLAPFRQQFLYNNQMFLVAGLAAAQAGGAPYAELLDKYVFDPLGMDSSTTVLSEALSDERMSSGYRWLMAEQEHEVVPTRGIALCEPAGAILSCPSDMARYLSFLLARGTRSDGEPLLSRKAFEDDLWKIQVAHSPEGGCGLGFGLVKWRGRTIVHHDGGLDAFTSTLALLPEEGIGFSLLTNAELSAVPQMSIDITLATLLGEEPTAPVEAGAPEEAPYTPEELEELAGSFDFAAANQIWRVFVNEAGRLALDYPDQAVYDLAWPDETGRWAFAVAPQVQVAFHRDEAGAVSAMTVHNGAIEIRMPRRTTEGLPTLDEVLALMAKAMPPAAIEAACPLRMVGAVELVHQGLSGRFEMLYQDESHWRIDRSYGKFGRDTTVVNGDGGWRFSTVLGRADLSAAERAAATREVSLSPLSETRDFYRSIRILDVEGEGDDARILLRTVPLQGLPAILRIDAEGSVRRADGSAALGELATIPIETIYADIRTVHGMRLAHRVETSNPATGLTRIITEKIETNVEVPATAWEE